MSLGLSVRCGAGSLLSPPGPSHWPIFCGIIRPSSNGTRVPDGRNHPSIYRPLHNDPDPCMFVSRLVCRSWRPLEIVAARLLKLTSSVAFSVRIAHSVGVVWASSTKRMRQTHARKYLGDQRVGSKICGCTTT